MCHHCCVFHLVCLKMVGFFQNKCDRVLPCAGGAAGGGYAQVIPMEEVRQPQLAVCEMA